MVIIINLPAKLPLKTFWHRSSSAIARNCALPEGRKCAFEIFWHSTMVLCDFLAQHLGPSGISLVSVTTF
jgi:hypothetical protein